MERDVLISYSQADKTIADAVCATLEKRGIRCWIAPRDISPGAEWASAIAEAIPASGIFVLIHSKSSNESRQVMREVERAVHYGLTIIPFRTEEVDLSKSLEYFISSCHWLDAMTPPLEAHIQRLADRALQLLSDVPASADEGHQGRVSCGKAYRLGFSLAKMAWHYGENLEKSVLQDQIITFAADLSLPKEILAAAIAQFTSASDPKALLRNAHSGVEARNAIASLVNSRLGARAAAAFRLGFGIVNVMPQFEFLSMGQQADLPFQELAGPIASQIENLTEDAVAAGIPEKWLSMLKSVDADPKKADAARMLLVMIGGAIDGELNGNP